jgi:hypothetical protein
MIACRHSALFAKWLWLQQYNSAGKLLRPYALLTCMETSYTRICNLQERQITGYDAQRELYRCQLNRDYACAEHFL